MVVSTSSALVSAASKAKTMSWCFFGGQVLSDRFFSWFEQIQFLFLVRGQNYFRLPALHTRILHEFCKICVIAFTLVF